MAERIRTSNSKSTISVEAAAAVAVTRTRAATKTMRLALAATHRALDCLETAFKAVAVNGDAAWRLVRAAQRIAVRALGEAASARAQKAYWREVQLEAALYRWVSMELARVATVVLTTAANVAVRDATAEYDALLAREASSAEPAAELLVDDPARYTRRVRPGSMALHPTESAILIRITEAVVDTQLGAIVSAVQTEKRLELVQFTAQSDVDRYMEDAFRSTYVPASKAAQLRGLLIQLQTRLHANK